MTHFKPFLISTLAALGLGAPALHAALPYADGDLLLGFRATGGTGASSNYLINLGPSSQFTTGAAFTLSIGVTGLDLTGIFGADWTDRADLFWSVSGAGKAGEGNTLYATRARASDTLGTPAAAWFGRSNSAQGTTLSKFQALAGNYSDNGTAFSPSSPKATLQNSSDANSYAYFQPGGVGGGTISFQAFSPTIEGNFGASTEGSVIDLFKIVPDTVLPLNDLPAQRLGSFAFNDAGTLSFTGSAVPEPGSALLLGLGMSLLGTQRLRRQKLSV